VEIIYQSLNFLVKMQARAKLLLEKGVSEEQNMKVE